MNTSIASKHIIPKYITVLYILVRQFIYYNNITHINVFLLSMDSPIDEIIYNLWCTLPVVPIIILYIHFLKNFWNFRNFIRHQKHSCVMVISANHIIHYYRDYNNIYMRNYRCIYMYYYNNIQFMFARLVTIYYKTFIL